MNRNRGIDQMYSTGAARRFEPNARNAEREETRPNTARRIAAMIATYARWPHGIIRRITFLWRGIDRKSTRLNSSHITISYAVFCLKKQTDLQLRHDKHNPGRPSTNATAVVVFARVPYCHC